MNLKAYIIGIVVVLTAAGIATIGFTVPFEVAVGKPVCLGAAGLLLAIGLAGILTKRWLEPLLVTLGVLSFGALAYGAAAGDGPVAGAGLVSLVLTLATTAITLKLDESREPVEGKRSFASDGQIEEMLRRIHDHTMLSESAKRVLFRERELDMLRGAIEADIRRGDYNAALRLCDDMADLFGFRQEAETFRARLEQSRRDDSEAQVAAAMEQLDTMLAERNWAASHDIAGRIRRLFPDSHHVADIDNRIERARDDHKNELEEQFLDAAHREDVELAMERLRELDRYLDPNDASRIEEVAHGIVAKHKDNLSVRFKLAVNGHDWEVAARIGEAIMHEFPNAKMAEEVRSMIDVIRTRASQAAVASEES